MKAVCVWRGMLSRGVHFSSVRTLTRPSPEIDSIIRVDHAGELGADRIYAGQMAVLGGSKMGPLIQHMWEQEKVHKATFETLITKYRVRPTAMVPVWNVAGFLLGAGTALMGEKAAMACTVAVESVIVDHYNDQLRTLMADPDANKELMQTIQKFRDEEQEHHDTGLDQGAEQAPFYSALTEVIKVGCKAAIAISKGAPLGTIHARYFSTSTNRRDKWDLYSGVALERKPLVSRELTPFEAEYARMLAEVEDEQSYKSHHEMRHEADLRQAEQIKQKDLMGIDIDTTLGQTAQDFEDACIEELNQFKFTPRETKDDKKSLNRKLDSHLLLLVREEWGGWMLPKGARFDGETMREAAERVLKEKCGDQIEARFLGNAPCGFYKYKYPKSNQTDSVGAKVFFFKALLLSPGSNVNSKLDFMWATRDELPQILTNDKYFKNVKMFLVDEDEPLAVKKAV